MIYFCPMHPQVTSDDPGDCPICGMDLVPRQAGEGEVDQRGVGRAEEGPSEGAKPGAAGGGEAHVQGTPTGPAQALTRKTMYRSTMNPGEVSDRPGKDSMGMEMVPFEVEAAPREGLPGLAAVTIAPETGRRMGITYGLVERRALARDVRTSALIVPDETRLYRVTTKVEGYVERLHINVTGQPVRRGQPLLDLFSPELVASQEEFFSALRAARSLEASPHPSVAQGGRELVEAARRRLRLWDISEEQISRIESTGEVERTLTLYAPAGGHVAEKNVLAGQKVMPGDSLMVIADLSRVWGQADIYESDLPYIKVGMPAELTLPYWPGQVFQGRITFLDPILDPASRTLKARLEIANPGLLLRPNMFGNARLAYDLGERLAVPEGAVMRSGMQNFVFLAGEEGRLTPVAITLGLRSAGYFEVLGGLEEGERVVTSANFLIDSESSLKAALQAVSGRQQ
jgi:RND family efflux transporter MFP subunit